MIGAFAPGEEVADGLWSKARKRTAAQARLLLRHVGNLVSKDTV